MTRPGVDSIVRAQPPARGGDRGTGTYFIAGVTEKGPVDEARPVRSVHDARQIYGDRVSFGWVDDGLDVAFREGCRLAYVSRVLHTATAVKADLDLLDQAAVTPVATLTVAAKDPGDYGNRLDVQVVAGAGTTRVLVVFYDDVEVERTWDLATIAEFVDWGTHVSTWVDVTDLASATVDAALVLPAVLAKTPLVGGLDNRSAIVDADWTAALARFGKLLGPGQVSTPGRTSTAAHVDLNVHAQANNRWPLYDAANTGSKATLDATADALRAGAGVDATYGILAAPYLLTPGITRLVPRVMPPSPTLAGMLAKRDRELGVQDAPAGAAGKPSYGYGVTFEFTDAEREELNETGVSTFRVMHDGVRLYGFTTPVDRNDRGLANVEDLEWVQATHGRLRMALVFEGEEILEHYLFQTVDGKGIKLAEIRGDLLAMLGRYYNRGALYGATAPEAYSVDVGPGQNPPEALADGELTAALEVRMSPFVEHATLLVVKRSITEVLAA